MLLFIEDALLLIEVKSRLLPIFSSKRTFAVKADKAAVDLDIGLIKYLKLGRKVKIEITTEK